MMTTPRTKRLLRLLTISCAAALLLATLLLATSVLLAPGRADARGAEAAPQPAKPNPQDGPIYFDQAVRWVNAGRAGIHQVSDFFADLHNVKLSVEGSNHEGYMRLWLKTPDKYRVELRPQKPLERLTTKILDKDQMWIVHPTVGNQGVRVERMHGRPGGAEAIVQLTNDRKRLMDLARFLTLEGLKGTGVQFINEGTAVGSETFAGNWLRVRRRIAGGADVIFYFAYVIDPRDPSGRTVSATYPGVVMIEGNPAAREPTEYYLLQDWKSGPQFRFPGKIQAFRQDGAGAPRRRFLLAFPNDIRINTNLPNSTFAPPP